MRPGLDYIGVGVGVVLVDNQGRLLLTKRSGTVQGARNQWEFPGGHVEHGETFEQAAIREVREELNVEITPLERVEIYENFSNEGHHYIACLLLARIASGEPQIMEPEKCTAMGFYTIEEAEKMELTHYCVSDIRLLREKYPQGLIHIYI